MTATVTQLASQAPLPVSNVSIDGEQVGISVQKLGIDVRPGKHETATITLMASELDVTRFRDKPIVFDWGTGGTSERFVGYVTGAAKPQQFQSQPNVVLTCAGPTWPMSNGRPRYWVNQTSEAIARETVTRHGLRLLFDQHWYRWAGFSQTTESDWGLLQKLAVELGYVVFTYGGVLRMVDPTKLLTQQAPVASLAKSSNILDENQDLLDFQPSAISESDRSVQKPSYGYMAGDGTPVTVNANGGNFVSTYIPDGDNARLADEVVTRATSFWTQEAQARIRGRANIFPGATVTVNTGGSNLVSDVYDGQWMVVGLTHSIDSSAFTTMLYLVRNAMTSSVQATKVAQFWNQARQPRPKLTLINGAWVDSR